MNTTFEWSHDTASQLAQKYRPCWLWREPPETVRQKKQFLHQVVFCQVTTTREAKAKESSFKYWMRWYWSLSKWRLVRTHTNLLELRARPGDPWDRAIGEHLPFWLGRVTGELTQGFARGAGLCVRLVRLYFGVLTLGITGEKALRDIADECLKAGQRDSGPRDKPGS